MSEPHNIVCLSGGRTSAFMLRRLLDTEKHFAKRFTILFANTGKEMDATLDFVHEIETRWNVPVIWLEYTRVPASTVNPEIYPSPVSRKHVLEAQANGGDTHWFKVVDYATAHRNGQPNSPFDELLRWMNVLPNPLARSCTGQLKVRTMMRYLYAQGIQKWNDFIGIRADEWLRAVEILSHATKARRPRFPLIEQGITVDDINAYWSDSDFDLNLKSYLGNCDLCFLKSTAKRIQIMRERPELVPWWMEWEQAKADKGSGARFSNGKSYASLWAEAEAQGQLPPDEGDIPCGCADKGFALPNIEEYDL
jgi:3'-phosphoadenosine 5'-phosphosulfate sulfotransferase (PAPS reductase)/FAD synthetase